MATAEEEGGVEAAKGVLVKRSRNYVVGTHAVVVVHNLFWMWILSRGFASRGKKASGIPGLLRIIATCASATLVVDMVTYFTHLSLDNYFSEKGILAPLVKEFILHHHSPQFQLQTYVENAWREGLFSSSLMVVALATGFCNLRNFFSTTFWGVFGFWGSQISAIHKAAHITKPDLPYAIAQKIGLIIDRRHHMKHHATLASNYSLLSGHFEVVFERLRGVECLEVVMYLLTGTVSRNSRLGMRQGEGQQIRQTFGQRFQYLKWSVWYTFFNDLANRSDWGLHFMNWGYCKADGEQYAIPPGAERVLGQDPRSRTINGASLQLYLHLLEGVPVEGRDVAEVSSGRGGFLACLAGSGSVRSCLGLDACAAAVTTCRRIYADLPKLSFRHGDAMASLGCSVDVLVNVEASHCYPSRETFFGQVHRALKPGGHFLFADFMTEVEADQCVAWLEAEGRFEVEIREDITPAVLRAMERTNDAKISLIKETTHRCVHALLERFAATSGSKSRGDADDGWRGAVYLHLRARRL